uniref:Phosphofructokinase domain-containing protein n=1 Tax=Asterionellopsis glacialis TaxID=33640 RepID=A0A6T9Y745_9STRA|mmetsp:Transcript_1098/g.1536  ORF Transcript_1098/g.1536 Transcript_1098/m.1536 type:complete len:582 (+) Transcript_1098:283-2028(+)
MMTIRAARLILALYTVATVATAFTTLPISHRRTTWGVVQASIQENNNNNAAAKEEKEITVDECSLDEEDALACLESVSFYEKDTSSFMTVTEVFVAEVESLRDKFPSFENDGDQGSNMMKFNKRNKGYGLHSMPQNGESSDGDVEFTNSHVANVEYNQVVADREVVLVDTIRNLGMKSVSRAFHRAGPRKLLHFDPSKVNAAIVTCGGLCPGLNNVIRELTHSLYYLYGAKKVYGITGGFNGFHDPDYPPVHLTNELVENIHHEGGTVLRSGRGGFDINKILEFIKEKDIQQLYVIGGDGTHRGAYAISQACQDENMNVGVAGIPKTIDNDVDYIDRSFGFVSAVEAAQAAIRTGKTEAMCNVPNGIGIIKLMGRSAGFLAAFAALGSGDVDLVLVPEVPIVLDGPDGILPFLRQRVKEQKYAVVVVAEGAGEELLGVSDQVDAGGNRELPKIGDLIKDEIGNYFDSFGEVATIKYIDPSYTVRSVAANGADSLYCMQLAQNAVHGAMAGITGFSTGLVGNCAVYLPIPQLVSTSPRSMSPYGRTWERILAMTGQPNTAPKRQDEDFEEDFAPLPEPFSID